MKKFEGYTRGVNLGGWLSQCGSEYNDKHYSEFITEKDIETLATWGIDHVRVPVDYNVIVTEEGEFIESGFSYIDRCVEWCRKNKLKMVFDIHKTKGFVFDDPNYAGFFENKELQDYFVAMWEEIVRRYAKDRDVVAFELMNEVTERRFADVWNDISARTIKAIRAIDKDVTIIVGGVFNSSIFGLTLLNPPQDDKIVYTMHIYNPFIFTHQSAGWLDRMPKDYEVSYPGKVKDYFEASSEIFGHDYDSDYETLEEENLNESYFEHLFVPALEVAQKYNVPIYCGEYGVIDYAKPEDTLIWFKHINAILKKYDIARAAWTYKDMNFGLNGSHYAPVIEELKKYL